MSIRSATTSARSCAGRTPRQTYPGEFYQMTTSACARLLSSLLPLALLGHFCSPRAHDPPTGGKYPWACCSNMDCQPVQSSAVLEKPQGYFIQSTGEVVSYGDKRI